MHPTARALLQALEAAPNNPGPVAYPGMTVEHAAVYSAALRAWWDAGSPLPTVDPGENINAIRFALLAFTPDDDPDISTLGLAEAAERTQRELVKANDTIRELREALEGVETLAYCP